MLKALVAALALALCVGCACNMTGIAPSSCPITGDDSYTIIGPVTSYSGGCHFLGAIPICANKPSQKCLQRALKKSGGDALIEVTMDTTFMMIPFIYPYWTRLQGTAIKFKRGGAEE